MTSERSILIALDQGTATSSAALLGRVDGRWRLLGAVSGPATVPIEPAIADLVGSVRAADPALASSLGLPDPADPAALDVIPRLVARSAPAPVAAVLAASGRALPALVAAAEGAGWRVRHLDGGETDPIEISRLVLDPAVSAVIAGAGEPPGADERRGLADLVRLVGTLARRRPELRILLAGGAVDVADGHVDAFVALPAALRAAAGDRPGSALLAALRAQRPAVDESRDAIARATASLAEVLDRRIETIEVGAEGGLRAVAEPTGDGRGSATHAHVVAGALFPPDPDDDVLVAIAGWSTVPRDRNRLRDRLLDLRREPWSEIAGDGAFLRLSAARAAVERIVRATPALDTVPPDLIVAAGGCWLGAPGPAVMLALADVVRRPGVSQYALDAARLLGPLGTVEDEDERRALLADLADDILVPLGSAIVAGEVHRSRHPGTLVVEATGARTELELVVGGLQLVDLPPGELARASITFRDPVLLGARGRAFEVEVSGGLGGLLVDLRDIPLHLPERAERRRELLASWQGALWTGLEA